MKKKRALIYISHPFRGIEANRERAREITALLSGECGFNNYIFINPLDLFMGQSKRANLDAIILSQAVEVMQKCDGVIFCEGWRKSRGCRVEHFAARKAGIPRWIGHEAFIASCKDEEPYRFWVGFHDALAQTWGYKDLADYLRKRSEEREKEGGNNGGA